MIKQTVFILTASCLLFGVGCKKEVATKNQQLIQKPVPVKETNETITSRIGYDCNSLSPLAYNSSGDLQGGYGGITIAVNSPYWRISCDDGSPITLQNYQPFYGNMYIPAGVNATVVMQPGVSNQFLIVAGTMSITDWDHYGSKISEFNNAWNTYVSHPDSNMAVPHISDFLSGSNPSLIEIPGKLVRTTTGSTFAAVGICRPDNFPCRTIPILEAKQVKK